MGHKSVCTSCRISFNYGTDFNNIITRKCPQCKIEMINVSQKFKPPKKREIKKWELVKFLLDNGFYFHSVYEYNPNSGGMYSVKYPENINEAIVFVEKYKSQKGTNRKKLLTIMNETVS